MQDLGTLGARIVSVRKDRHLRQAELAKLAGLSTKTIHTLENGRGDIGYSKLSRVLAALGLELELRPTSKRPTLDDLLRDDSND